MNHRIDQLINELKQRSIDSMFITSKANIFYFSQLYAEAHERLIALYIDQKGNRVLVVPALELEDVKNTGWKEAIITYYDHEDPWEKFNEWVKKTGFTPSSIGIEEESLNVQRYKLLQKHLPTSELVDGQLLLNQMRVIKDESEASILQEAAKFADFGVETAVKHIQPGKTELEIIAQVEYALKKEGIRHMSFSTLVLSGDKTAAPHGNPSTKVIESGDFVLMDLGVIHNGYCSDITRTVAVGDISDEQKEIYNTVLNAELAGLDACQIGTPLGEIDRAARDVIEKAGYGEYFTHRIGHGLGIDVHEFPSMASNNQDPLQAGMSFTIEPGIYLPGAGGVRIEDDVLMTKQGAKTLTKYPKELIIL
ncbi:M24 family metallopeptidase [Alkalibacillus aidingensis]|uniref:M24 family metallopeptidase n=1 Tax=Alkalibacillus aidingensis TaxID=2747607 RepID=UPI0016603AD7|nr:Xaa-Pro peptidase family protein [Alkalibacillus aidingensis]